MDKLVHVFVVCEPSQLEKVLVEAATLGFSLKMRAKFELGKVIGSIEQSKIPELEKLPGVISVVGDFPLDPFKP
ncbi:MAG: hypothetical protein AAB345_03165 [Patescibacteria group bacterium]